MSGSSSLWRKSAADRPGGRGPRILPNTAAIGFGLAGLSGAWRAGTVLIGVPVAVANVILIIAAVAWLVQAVGYVAQGPRTIAHDWRDPAQSPFLALIVVTPMLLAADLSHTAFAAGRVLVIIFLILTVIVGGLMTGEWIVEHINADAMHPGYFLPTVAGGFLGAYAAAVVHLHAVAEVIFGLGLFCWMLVGSNVLYRLFFRASLPPALVPTLAIEIAPPAVAGFAWFAITGGSTGLVSRLFAGYAILMALVQLRLIPVYAKLKFSVSFWAFTFSYAAVALDALLWLAFTRAPGARAWGILALVLISLLVTAIAARTVVALARGEFFPSRQAAPEE